MTTEPTVIASDTQLLKQQNGKLFDSISASLFDADSIGINTVEAQRPIANLEYVQPVLKRRARPTPMVMEFQAEAPRNKIKTNIPIIHSSITWLATATRTQLTGTTQYFSVLPRYRLPLQALF
jgi:hypothetical protein